MGKGKGLGEEHDKGIRPILSLSRAFVAAYHATSTPYLAFSPAFSMKNEVLSGFLLDGSIPNERITQRNLKGDFADVNKYEFYNITSSTQYENDVETILLSPTAKPEIGLLKQDDDFSFYTFRFLINRKLGSTLFEPCQSIPSIHNKADIAALLPEALSLVNEKQEQEGRKVAYRLLSYAVNYLFGKAFLEGLKVTNYKLYPTLGFVPNGFMKWLDETGTPAALNAAWEAQNFFANGEFRDDTTRDLFDKWFDTFFPAGEKIGSYYATLSVLFRKLADEKFRGVPLKVLVEKLTERCDISARKAVAAILMLADSGEADVHVYEHEQAGIIGFYVNHGEVSYYAIYNTQPSYAYYLQQLQNTDISQLVVKNCDYFTENREHIKEHFEQNKKHGVGLSVDTLIRAMDDVEKNHSKWSPPYCALPRTGLYDSSEAFFLDLQNDIVDTTTKRST
jgi:hypothetical protein